MKVLIIDDEEDTRSICSMSLGLIDGAEVVEAGSGKEGIEKAANHKPDVIILDLLMPEMDGSETLRGLRRNPVTAEIPVIFLTTKGMFAEFEGLKSLGALAVLTKPFDPIRIGTQIQEILAGANYAFEPNAEPAKLFPGTCADSKNAAELDAHSEPGPKIEQQSEPAHNVAPEKPLDKVD